VILGNVPYDVYAYSSRGNNEVKVLMKYIKGIYIDWWCFTTDNNNNNTGSKPKICTSRTGPKPTYCHMYWCDADLNAGAFDGSWMVNVSIRESWQ
jgi:hypothetical protein